MITPRPLEYQLKETGASDKFDMHVDAHLLTSVSSIYSFSHVQIRYQIKPLSYTRDKRCIDMQIGVLQGKLFNNQRKH
jgi:hypothetical protein